MRKRTFEPEHMAYIRAIVSDEEKQAIKDRAKALNLNESELIRQGLKKMGVEVEVEKPVGISPVNKGNPLGNPELYKSSPKYQKRQKKGE